MQQQIGKYTLIRKLATGGMAEVYLARADGPMGFAKTLVLKRILPHLAEDQNFIDMFLGEAKLAAQLNHPNVVQIFDFGEAEGAYFIAMEFIDGPNLRALAKRAAEIGQRLPIALCAKAISFACEGLAFAHEFCDPETGEELGLIHRDISPDNILLSKQGAVKVVDFGIAKAAGQGHHTKTGTLKGKLAYMPPEQLSGKQLDKRTDIFALGIVLYELICGQKPFDAASEVSIMQAILYEPLIPATQRRDDVPEAMLQILDRAMAKNRDERYSSCREFQADLEQFIMSSGQSVGAYQLSQLVAQLAAPQGQPTATPPGAGSGPKSNPNLSPRTPANANVPAQRTPSSANVPATRPPSNANLRPQIPNAPPRTSSSTSGVKAQPQPQPPPQTHTQSIDVPLETAVTAALGAEGPHTDADVIPLTAKRPAEPAKSKAPLIVGAAGLLLVAAAVGIVVMKKGSADPQPLPIAAVTPDVKPEVKPKVETPPEVKPVEVKPPVEEPKQVAVIDAGTPLQVAVVAPPVVPEEQPVEKVEKTGKNSKKKKGDDKKKGGSVAGSAVTQTETTKTIIIPASGGQVKEKENEKPAASLASFEVVSVPAAQVRVNGKFISMSPAKVQNLQPGEVKVEVYDSKAGFSKSQTFSVQSGDNGTKRIVVEQGTLEFRIRPYATVFLDGKPMGETPIPPVPVFEGSHEIKMVNRDLKVDKTVSFVAKGGSNTFKFNLEE